MDHAGGSKCCTRSAVAKSPSCCASRDDSSAVRLVTLDSYRKCRGAPPLWLVLQQAVPARVDVVRLPAPLAGHWLAVPSDSFAAVSFGPEPRPPRAL
jgi:hypothetical protein